MSEPDLGGLGSADGTDTRREDTATIGDRTLAVRLFNQTWDLLDRADRSAADDRLLLAGALASRLHWEGVGNDENYAVGDWLVAHVAARLGYGELALDFATAAHDRVTAAGDEVPRWLLASTQEGLARAHAAAGHPQERDRFGAAARKTLTEVDDAEDRELIESQLATVPGLD